VRSARARRGGIEPALLTRGLEGCHRLRDDVTRRFGIQPACDPGRHVGGPAAYRGWPMALLRAYHPGNGADAVSGDGLAE